MVSNSVPVELQCVCNSEYCVQRVNSLFMNTYNVFNTKHNSTCTVAGPDTCIRTTVESAYKELKLYSSFALTVCACAKRVCRE